MQGHAPVQNECFILEVTFNWHVSIHYTHGIFLLKLSLKFCGLFKILNGLSPPYIQDLFRQVKTSSTYSLRSAEEEICSYLAQI